MANYVAKFRTNYFTVKNDGAFEELMARAGFTTKQNTLFFKTDADGVKYYAFGSEDGSLTEVIDPDYNEDAEEAEWADDIADMFIADLQKHVRDDDCIVIQTIGGEKLRYVTAGITIITSTKVTGKDLQAMADELVTRAMGRPFATEYDY